MREIKFRVWDCELKNFVREDLMEYDDFDVRYFNDLFQVKNYQMQQYTGLKDKNGKEIYEGDILKDENGFLYEVYWYDITASFELAERQELPDDYSTPIFHFRSMFKLEITGNIFDELNRN